MTIIYILAVPALIGIIVAGWWVYKRWLTRKDKGYDASQWGSF